MIFMDNKYTRWYFSIISSAKKRDRSDSYFEKHHVIPDCFYVNRSRQGPKGDLPGDPNDPSNMVYLTAREHFICHLLLPRMVSGNRKRQMWFAAWSLSNRKMHTDSSNNYICNSRTYEKLKTRFSAEMSELHSNKQVSDDTKRKISVSKAGKKLSDDHKRNIGEGQRGRVHSDETKEKISKSNIGKHSAKGRKHSNETKLKISIGNKGKTKGPLSEDTKQKISISGRGRSQSEDHVRKRINSRKQGSYYANREETIARMKTAAANRPRIECEHCQKTVSPAMYARWHGECKSI